MGDTAQVFLFAFATAPATGLGALPFLFLKGFTRRWLGASNAVAGGLVLAASFGLIYEGISYGVGRTAFGALVGLAFIILTRNLLHGKEHHVAWAETRGVDPRRALLMVGVMTAHSFTEGIGVEASFGGGQYLGFFITIAIAVHDICEGVAITGAGPARGRGG